MPADPGAIAAVLEGLQEQAPTTPPSLWERFREWLKSAIDRQAPPQQDWLIDWLRERAPSDALLRGIRNTAVVLILVLAVVIVVREVRAARAPEPRQRPNAGAPRKLEEAIQQQTLSLTVLDRAELAARPALLLRLLILELVGKGRLRAERPLTHSELVRHAQIDASDERDAFVKD